MVVEYSAKFKRLFKKLPPEIKTKTRECIKKFLEFPNDPSLYFHKLHHSPPRWAFTINYDWRIILTFEEPGLALLVNIGPHDDVY